MESLLNLCEDGRLRSDWVVILFRAFCYMMFR